MASPTFSPTYTVFGNYRVVHGTADFTGLTSGAFATGLNNVIYGNIAYVTSFTSGNPVPKCYINMNSGVTAQPGYIMVQSCTAGDEFAVFAFGN